MSNTAYLIANDDPGGAAGDVGWDPGEGEMVAEGPLAVPVFWLALFDEGDLIDVELDDEDGETLKVPSLVAQLDEARRRFRERKELITARFPEFEAARDQFAAVLAGLQAGFVKIDVLEVWDIVAAVGEDFEPQLRAAVRWFETRDEDDFDQLLEVASIRGYDIRRRSFDALDDDVPRAFHLRGYASAPANWDDDADA